MGGCGMTLYPYIPPLSSSPPPLSLLLSAHLLDEAYLALHIILNCSVLFHTVSSDAFLKSWHISLGARWIQTHTCALSLWHCDLWLARLFRSCRTEQRGQKGGWRVRRSSLRKGLLLWLTCGMKC